MYKLSVIVPCYNAEGYIVQCLESLVNQTIGIENMQIILVNDASTDGTLAVLEKYKNMYDDNILLINQNINQGQAIGRNKGLDNAAGEYIAFLDADDWLELDAYEKLLDIAYLHDVDLVQMNYVKHFEGVAPFLNECSQEQKLYNISNAEDKIDFYSRFKLLPIWAGIYRAKLFENGNLRFADFRKYEDNYWGEILKDNIDSYYFLNEYMHHYRVILNSNSNIKNDMEHFIRLEVELEKLKYFSENNMYERYYKTIRSDFLEGFYVNTIHIIFCKFDYIPLHQIKTMQNIVRQFFPDYLNYYQESNMEFDLILTVPFDFPIEVWQDLKKDYLYAISNQDFKKITIWAQDLKASVHLFT